MSPIGFLVNVHGAFSPPKQKQTKSLFPSKPPFGMHSKVALDILKTRLRVYEPLFIIAPQTLTIPPIHGNMFAIAKLNMVSLTISQYHI